MVGVDLMIGADWRSLAVAEVNAFGDLLPGLTGLPGGPGEGLDTYAAQIAAVSRGWRPGMQSRGIRDGIRGGIGDGFLGGAPGDTRGDVRGRGQGDIRGEGETSCAT
jgi:hypothetical protein